METEVTEETNPYNNIDHIDSIAKPTQDDVLAAAGIYNLVGSTLKSVDEKIIGDGKFVKAEHLDPKSIHNMMESPDKTPQVKQHTPVQPKPTMVQETQLKSNVINNNVSDDDVKRVLRLLVQKLNTIESTINTLSKSLNDIVSNILSDPHEIVIKYNKHEHDKKLPELDQAVLDFDED